MKNKNPQPGEKYRHYKGGEYEVICMCNHTETNEILVIYRSLSFGGFHARPYIEWFEELEEKDKYGFYPIRFERIYRLASMISLVSASSSIKSLGSVPPLFIRR
jgi:hypothetical protein